MDEMKKVPIDEIVFKLIGHIDAQGEHNYDKESFDNLDDLEPLLYSLISEVIDNVKHKNRVEYSMKEIGNRSQQIINEIYEVVKDYTEE